MNTRANYFKIGLFVILTVIILIAGIIAISAGTLRQNKLILETYIDESVQGLNVGSPVLQRGVQIGRVDKLTFVPKEYTNVSYDRFGRYVMVIIAIEENTLARMGTDREQQEAVIHKLVDGGLRLKLSYQGITGVAYIEADYVDPARNKPMQILWEPKNLYIPSVPSTFKSFTQAIDTVFQRLNNINFEGIALSLTNTLKTIDEAVKEAQIAQTRERLAAVMNTFEEAITNAQIGPTRERLVALMDELGRTNMSLQELLVKSDEQTSPENIPHAVAQFTRTLEQLEDFVASQQADFEGTLQNLKEMSANLRELTENAKRYPSQLLFGAPPPQPEVLKNEKQK